jgi:putative DNA primase/helicase
MKLALAFAAAGYARGPCGRLTKAPLIKGGHNAFSNDPVQIAEWRARFPGALWGLRCGDVFDVLDLDGAEGFAWLRQHESELPATRVQLTPRGKHLYFLPDARLRPSVGKIAEGVDVRARGSYVIDWSQEGFAVEDRPIAAWPEWLAALAMDGGCNLRVDDRMDGAGTGQEIDELRALIRARTRREHPGAATVNLCRRTERILRIVEQAKPRTRNVKLYWAACRFGEIIGEGRLEPKVAQKLLKSAAQLCGLVRDDGERAVVATILSGLRRGFGEDA